MDGRADDRQPQAAGRQSFFDILEPCFISLKTGLKKIE